MTIEIARHFVPIFGVVRQKLENRRRGFGDRLWIDRQTPQIRKMVKPFVWELQKSHQKIPLEDEDNPAPVMLTLSQRFEQGRFQSIEIVRSVFPHDSSSFNKNMKQKKRSLKPIGLFLLYTFAITWMSWLIIIIGNKYFNTLWYGESLFWILDVIGSLGPAISSYIIYRQFNEDFGEESFVKYIFGKKIDIKVWLIFGLFSLWRLFMIWIAFGINKPISILSIIINLPLLILLGGLEELGWRGILQPKLEKLINYLPSVLIVGIIWGIWHLPLWLIKGTVQSSFPFGLYLFSGIVLASSFTTLYKYTNNLFLCVLSHAWFNGCIGLALYVGNNGALQMNFNWKVVVVFSLELIVSVILGVTYSRKKLLLSF